MVSELSEFLCLPLPVKSSALDSCNWKPGVVAFSSEFRDKNNRKETAIITSSTNKTQAYHAQL